VTLSGGTNVFSAYSVDEAGNDSATNSIGSFVTLLQPKINNITFGSNVVTVYFSSLAGATYSLEYKNSLTDAVWTAMPATTNGTGNPMTLVDSLNFVMPVERIYRVQAVGTNVTVVPPSVKLKFNNNQVMVSLPSQTGVTYSLAYRNSAGGSAWTVLPGSVNGTGGTVTLIDTLVSPATRFYRLEAQTP
jgi:hypothetical protein